MAIYLFGFAAVPRVLDFFHSELTNIGFFLCLNIGLLVTMNFPPGISSRRVKTTEMQGISSRFLNRLLIWSKSDQENFKLMPFTGKIRQSGKRNKLTPKYIRKSKDFLFKL